MEVQDIRCDRASNGIYSESLALPSFSPSLGLRLSVSAGLDSSLSLPETILFHQGVSLCHPPSPSCSFFLSSSPPHLHIQVNHVSCLSASSPLRLRLCVSVFPLAVSPSVPSRWLRSLPVCLPVSSGAASHSLLSVLSFLPPRLRQTRWARRSTRRTWVHEFNSLLEMLRLDGECGRVGCQSTDAVNRDFSCKRLYLSNRWQITVGLKISNEMLRVHLCRQVGT